MVAIPLIYFSILAYYYYKKARRVDLAVYITLIYAVSGLFSVLLDMFSLRNADIANYDISMTAVIVYCFSITLILYPIQRFSVAYNKRMVPLTSDKVLRFFAVFGILYTLFYIIMSYDSIMLVLRGDMGAMRNDLYKDVIEVGWVGKLPSVIRMPVALLNHVVGAPWVFQLLAFFSFFVQKMPKKYGYMFLTTSLIGPLSGIIGVDRSSTTYWILSLVGCYIMFKPQISKNMRKGAIYYGLILLFLFFFYLWSVTSSRFDYSASYENSQSSIIDYLGKPFINFCFFYDTFDAPFSYYGIVFPFISNTLLGEFTTTVDWQDRVSLMSNVGIGTFYTFLGAIKLALGKLGMYLYLLIATIGGYILILPRSNLSAITLHNIFCYFLLASVPMLGLFGHYYSGGTKTFCIVLFFIVTSLICNKKRR